MSTPEVKQMDTKHTPGPWQGCLHLRANADETCGCGYRGGIWSTASDTMVCEIGGPVHGDGADMIPRGDRATQIADHWLIASSPDLLEALKAMVSDFEQRVQILGAKTDIAEVEVIAKARAAIAKAEGQS